MTFVSLVAQDRVPLLVSRYLTTSSSSLPILTAVQFSISSRGDPWGSSAVAAFRCRSNSPSMGPGVENLLNFSVVLGVLPPTARFACSTDWADGICFKCFSSVDLTWTCNSPNTLSLILDALVTWRSSFPRFQNSSSLAVASICSGNARINFSLGWGHHADQNVDRPPKKGHEPWQYLSSLVLNVFRESVQGNVSEGPPRTSLNGNGRF